MDNLALDLAFVPEPRWTVCIHLKGGHVERLMMPEANAVSLLEEIDGHIRAHGFRGWRRFELVVLNMEELQMVRLIPWHEADEQ
ncbi:hypothetical protein CCR90_08045 [Rhodovulum sulfidophilum]|uniref:hypothetical protein n=1 Tax=Rhodovulum sulfidophilum TaxID=35806 RepID=UPI001A92E7B3|nr:hypothetical protein [Rhodovulum sulfidophilum]MBK5923733.1 hypothetical protein [Rhodovulum sulfidophilum]